MIALRANGYEQLSVDHEIPSVLLQSFLEEARDLSFGSTLNEQGHFVYNLLNWIGTALPHGMHPAAAFPAQSLSGTHDEIFWDMLIEISGILTAWIPKMALALQITSKKDGAKAERLQISCDVAMRQIDIVEIILLHLHALDHPKWQETLVKCLWATSAEVPEAGLLYTIDQLTKAGVYTDPLLAIKLQSHIMNSVSRLVEVSSGNLLESLCDVGLVKAAAQFFSSAFTLMYNVSKLNIMSSFAKAYSGLTSAVLRIWGALVTRRNMHIVYEIAESRILAKLAEEWLIVNATITSVTSDPMYTPALPRHTALSLLSFLQSELQTIADSGITDRAMSRLEDEVCANILSSNILKSQVDVLTSHSKKKSQDAGQAKNMAAEILATLGGFKMDSISKELSLLEVSRPVIDVTMNCTKPNPVLAELWLEWAAGEEARGLAEESSYMHPPADAMDDDASGEGILSSENPAVRQAMQELWDEDEAPKIVLAKKTAEELAEEAGEGRRGSHRTVDFDHEHADPSDPHHSDRAGHRSGREYVDISLVMDRMGHFMLAVKSLYDKRATERGYIVKKEATGTYKCMYTNLMT
jgi:hypothetical protein